MDLTLPINDMFLNIRVAVLIQTKNGLILEKHKSGFYFVVGGRVKIDETSEEAARREIFEELGLIVKDMKYRATLEIFFGSKENRTHEICFVYSTEEIAELPLSKGLEEFSTSEIDDLDFRPNIMKQVILADRDTVLHIISREDTTSNQS